MSETAETISDRARRDILDAALPHIPFDGWTDISLKKAVSQTTLPKGAEQLYFPGGPLELIAFWSDEMDLAAEAEIQAKGLHNMRIRDRITEAVLIRLEQLGDNGEAARRAMARLSLPDALGQGPKQIWNSSDMIWRAIGDTSTDGNFYSKRTILSGVFTSTLLSWLADDEPGKPQARAFLDKRIQNVMQFEKVKHSVRKATADWPDPAEMLGRLRYGSRRRRRRSR